MTDKPSYPKNFRQQDVSRAIRAARIAGLDVDKVEIDPRTSKITIVAAKGRQCSGEAVATPTDTEQEG